MFHRFTMRLVKIDLELTLQCFLGNLKVCDNMSAFCCFCSWQNNIQRLSKRTQFSAFCFPCRPSAEALLGEVGKQK